MGNLVSMSCEIPVPPFMRYLSLNDLERSLEALQATKQEVSQMRDDLLERVYRAKERGLQVLAQVKVWIDSVEQIESEANRLLDVSFDKIQRLAMYGYCSLIFPSTYEYSEKVYKMLEIFKYLRLDGVFEVVSVRAPRMPAIYNQECLLESTWRRLMERNVGTLGIYGMGGIGKTTLLGQINNQFSEDEFGHVISVVVASKEVEDIQDEIGRRLGLQWGRETKEEKAAEIYRVLERERFVLLMDDIQREVELEEIGVPYPSKENGCKIVITTRSLKVCQMKWVEDRVEVELLPPYVAWMLFRDRVGEIALRSHPDILALARIVAEKCHGLPLALIVIGSSMAAKRTIQEWRHAVDALISNTTEMPEDHIFPILKVSYDILSGDEIRSCLLYCALFPEDGYIRRQDLVNYWVGERMVSDEIKGYEVITDLVSACLLTEDASGYAVMMHDVVREMALWIASDFGRQKEHFLVESGQGIYEMPVVNDWGMVKRMSVTSTQIHSISESPHCSELTTLFLQDNNKLMMISGDFFRWMASLLVLDLSHNVNLYELPEEVSSLVSLRLLNLSGTSIKKLPKRFQELVGLIHLDLESTRNLESITLISGLLKLQVLRLYDSSAALDISLLKDLERLTKLHVLTITVRENDVLKALLGSRLAGCTQGLYLEGLKVSGVSGKSFAATFGALGSLSKLGMRDCDIIESETEWKDNRRNQYTPSTLSNQITPSNTWFKNLSAVVILSCQHLMDLTWLMYAANLESLSVRNSPKMEQVISGKKAAGAGVEPFQKLQVLDLGYLNALESIHWSPLSFPRLQKVNITECSKLRKLPFNSTSVERIYDLRIEVDDGWLVGVEWESGAEERFRHVIHTAYVS